MECRYVPHIPQRIERTIFQSVGQTLSSSTLTVRFESKRPRSSHVCQLVPEPASVWPDPRPAGPLAVGGGGGFHPLIHCHCITDGDLNPRVTTDNLPPLFHSPPHCTIFAAPGYLEIESSTESVFLKIPHRILVNFELTHSQISFGKQVKHWQQASIRPFVTHSRTLRHARRGLPLVSFPSCITYRQSSLRPRPPLSRSRRPVVVLSQLHLTFSSRAHVDSFGIQVWDSQLYKYRLPASPTAFLLVSYALHCWCSLGRHLGRTQHSLFLIAWAVPLQCFLFSSIILLPSITFLCFRTEPNRPP